jgi:hypothetical protein
MEKKKKAKVATPVKKAVPAKKVVAAKKVAAPVKKVTVRAASPKTVERKPTQKILTAEGWKRRKMREFNEAKE